VGGRLLTIGLVALLLGAAGVEVVPPDESLSIERYRELGIPSLEREWSDADYEAALAILRDLPRTQLPRAGSPRSHALFERLLDTLRAPGLFERLAVMAASRRENLAEGMASLYGERADRLLFDRERVELHSAVARQILERLDELEEEGRWLASRSVPDSEDARELLERLQATRPQLREDLGGMLILSLAGMIEVGERSATHPSTRLFLRDELVELIPRAMHHLSEPRAAALREAIRVLASHEQNEAIRAGLMASTKEK
jgi:uncharacterized protein (DUF1778 family)